MPDAEMLYVPAGTMQSPPPTAVRDFKAAANAAVSFALPSPTAPYVLTLTTIGLVLLATASGLFAVEIASGAFRA